MLIVLFHEGVDAIFQQSSLLEPFYKFKERGSSYSAACGPQRKPHPTIQSTFLHQQACLEVMQGTKDAHNGVFRRDKARESLFPSSFCALPLHPIEGRQVEADSWRCKWITIRVSFN
jgi:hypothetical protein